MLLAEVDYPLLDIFWTMLFFFVLVTWFMLVFRIIVDLFRRDDMGGFPKALWILFVIVTPFLGVLAYVISQGGSMARRNAEDMQGRQAQFDAHVQSVAGSGGPAAEIEKAKSLLDSGAITQAEFEKLKAAALG